MDKQDYRTQKATHDWEEEQRYKLKAQFCKHKNFIPIGDEGGCFDCGKIL